MIKKNYTRVSSVLSMYTDFSNIDPAVLQRACDRGDRVHTYCQLYAQNMLIEPVDEDCKHFVDGFSRWFNTVVDEVLHVEQRLYCDTWKITGQVDLICKLKGSDTVYLIDLKTPVTPSKTWALQTAAYKYLAQINLQQIEFRGCLMLDREGRMPKMVSYNDFQRDLDLFFSACKLKRFFGG